MRYRLMMLLLVAAACAPVRGPHAASGAPEPAAREEIVRVLDTMFDAMRAGDGATLRRVFHPDARLVSFPAESSISAPRATSISDFIAAVGAPRDEVWDERIWDVRIEIDGPLATAWMQYAFHLDEVLSHCGVNAMQLYRSEDGWKVMHVADTRRREGCASR